MVPSQCNGTSTVPMGAPVSDVVARLLSEAKQLHYFGTHFRIFATVFVQIGFAINRFHV